MEQNSFIEKQILLKNLNCISDVLSKSISTKDFLTIPKQDNRVLLFKEAEALFGSIDALVRIVGIKADDPHLVFMNTLRFILTETEDDGDLIDTFLEMFYLPSDQSRDVHIAAISYFIQYVVYFKEVKAEIDKRLIKNPEPTKTSFQFQLFQYMNFRNAEKSSAEWVDERQKQQYNREKNLYEVMQAANNMVKRHPSGQGIIGEMHQFSHYRDVERTVYGPANETAPPKEYRPSYKQKQKLWDDKRQFEFMLSFFDEIVKLQKAAKLPPEAFNISTQPPVAELIQAKVKDWDEYFKIKLKKSASQWVEYLSPCLDTGVIEAVPGRGKSSLGGEVKDRQEDVYAQNLKSYNEEYKEIDDQESDEILPPTEEASLDFEDGKSSPKEVDDWSSEEPTLEELEKEHYSPSEQEKISEQDINLEIPILIQDTSDEIKKKKESLMKKQRDRIFALLKEALAETRITGDHDNIVKTILCFSDGTHTLKEIEAEFGISPRKFHRIREALKKSPKLAKDPILQKIVKSWRTITKSEDTKKKKNRTCKKCGTKNIPPGKCPFCNAEDDVNKD